MYTRMYPEPGLGVTIKELLLKILKFADDMCLLSESREGLQIALNFLSQYCKKWGVVINILKTAPWWPGKVDV